MSTVKKYLGQRSTLEVKQEILRDFSQALRLELEVELKQLEHNELFDKPNFYLRLDTGKIVRCDIFALIQCFKLKEKEKIDDALEDVFNSQGSINRHGIYVEHYDNNFHFFELEPREMNHYTDMALSFIASTKKIHSVEIPALKRDVELWTKSYGGFWCDLKENLDSVDWEIVAENQISGCYKPY